MTATARPNGINPDASSAASTWSARCHRWVRAAGAAGYVQLVPPFADRQAWQGVRPDVTAFVAGPATALAGTPWPKILAHHTSRYLCDGDRSEFETLYFSRRSRVIAHALGALHSNDLPSALVFAGVT